VKVFLIAGEPSGDLHAGNLIRALRRRVPQLEVSGMGGDNCQAAGMTLVRHLKGLSFMGYVDVLLNLRTILRTIRQMKEALLAANPDVLILVDYPGFNIRIAKFAKARGIKVFYYISPQYWAWRKGRIEGIRKHVDRLFCILPFEQEFYNAEGIEVDYVGHPLLDALAQTDDRSAQLREELQLDGRPVVALLPGSRTSEVSRLLPVYLQVVPRFPQVQFVVAAAPNRDRAEYESYIGSLPVKISPVGRTYDLLRLADAGLVCSGTATLETGLFAVPQVVGYSGNWISYKVAMWVLLVPYVSLVNLILGRESVRELLQYDFTPDNLAAELQRLLFDPETRQRMAADYTELRNRLGNEGASQRAADLMLERLGK
jgi:lipid-A-disaccharide synthase